MCAKISYIEISAVAVDENAFGQYGARDNTWKVFLGQMMHPVGTENQMMGQIEVVKASVGIRIIRRAYNQSAVDSVRLLMSRVTVVEVSAFIFDVERVAELFTERNRALRDVGSAIHELSFLLENSVPVNAGRGAFRFVRQIHNHDVVFTDVNRRPWQFKVDAEKAAFHSVGKHAFRFKTAG